MHALEHALEMAWTGFCFGAGFGIVQWLLGKILK